MAAMRMGTPLATCCRITDCGPSATLPSISMRCEVESSRMAPRIDKPKLDRP